MELTLPKSSAPPASRAAVYKLHDRSGLEGVGYRRLGLLLARHDADLSAVLGRVTRLMARPGEIVDRGKPLFYTEAADMVQAQKSVRSRAGMTRDGFVQVLQGPSSSRAAPRIQRPRPFGLE
jgi:hypothetical protein